MATKVAKAKASKANKNNQAVKVLNPCTCGCGGKTGSRFVPGHDAKLKSELQTAFREGTISAAQKALVKELGWERFMPEGNGIGARNTKAKDKHLLTVAQANILRLLAKRPNGMTRSQLIKALNLSTPMSEILGPEGTKADIAAVESRTGHKTLLGFGFTSATAGEDENGKEATVYVINGNGKKALTNN
jgi:hypothetical protein